MYSDGVNGFRTVKLKIETFYYAEPLVLFHVLKKHPGYPGV